MVASSRTRSDRQGIDVTVGVPEVGFQGLPSGLGVEPLQEQGQAVVAELDGADRLADEGLEGVVEFLGPGLDGGLAVVGTGEDVGDPDGDEPAIGESLVEGVGGVVAVEDLGELELDEESQEQGHVIDAFVGQFEGGVHGGSPTRDWGKSSLYRGGRAGGKIQAKKREHGNYRKVRLRHNSCFTVHLIREIRVSTVPLPQILQLSGQRVIDDHAQPQAGEEALDAVALRGPLGLQLEHLPVQLPLILLLDGRDRDRAPDLAFPVVPTNEHFHEFNCVEAIRLGPPAAAVDLDAGRVDDLIPDPLVQQEAMQPEAVAPAS